MGCSANRKRSATVRAEGGDVETLSLDRLSFFSLLEKDIIRQNVLEQMRFVQKERTNLSDKRLRSGIEHSRVAPPPPLGIPPALQNEINN